MTRLAGEPGLGTGMADRVADRIADLVADRMANGVLTARAATATDEPFLRELYALGREDELASLGWPEQTLRAFCDSQYSIRERAWRQTAPDAVDLVVLCEGAPVGRLCWVHTGEAIRVVDVATVPGVAGRGIGTGVLSCLLAEADAAGVPVHLHVRADSPARRLYERLGFSVEAAGRDDDVYVAMARPVDVILG